MLQEIVAGSVKGYKGHIIAVLTGRVGDSLEGVAVCGGNRRRVRGGRERERELFD
jgi:hypothetical protein